MVTSTPESKEPKQEQYLFKRRDDEEKDRLDQQSNLIRIVSGGHVLDPRIPKQNISGIADVATGTGIWLREVREELASEETSTPGNEFVIWDMTTTFPPEYHGTFDVVHIRFTVLALTSEQIKIVVGNLVELLKPRGYLQWTDISYRNGLEITRRVDDNDPPPFCESAEKLMFDYYAE